MPSSAFASIAPLLPGNRSWAGSSPNVLDSKADGKLPALASQNLFNQMVGPVLQKMRGFGTELAEGELT